MNKSDIYAERDNIVVERGSGRGFFSRTKFYCIPCSTCGDITKRKVYNGDKSYFCDYCKHQISRKKKELKQQELDKIKTKKEQAFDKAVIRIKSQVKNFNSYDNAIKLAKRRAEQYGSIPEAMVAIELVRLGHKVIPQQKIGKYKVDFIVKDKKFVIEVDGKLFHKDKYGGDREGIIQISLGMDWRIIHIPAELISKDIQKLKKIIEMYSKDIKM